MAKSAVMSPPGLLMYRLMSESGFSDSRWISWAQMRLATVSLMGVPRKTIRSRMSRE
jgi:hypothetical protein